MRRSARPAVIAAFGNATPRPAFCSSIGKGVLNKSGLVAAVPNFRLFYFRASRLERSETIEAADPLDAVHQASKRPSADLVELWSDEGRIAIFRPASRSGFE